MQASELPGDFYVRIETMTPKMALKYNFGIHKNHHCNKFRMESKDSDKWFDCDGFRKIWYKSSKMYILQVTFFEKGTKISPQTHILKFEIPYFSDNVSKIALI